MRFLKVFLLLLTLWYTRDFCRNQTEGFTMTRIQAEIPYNPNWAVKEYDKELVKNVLKQKFTYFAKGGQSFVFASEDGKYVLKLFKLDRYTMPCTFSSWPLPSFARHFFRRKEEKVAHKMLRDFTSYKLAFDELKEEAGLLLVHLNESEETGLQTIVVDPLHIAHPLDLSKTRFILQKRGEKVLSCLKRANGDEAKHLIDEILTALVERSKKGILDEDAALQRNLGIIEGKIAFLDIGRFVKDPHIALEEVYLKDVIHIAEKFRPFLSQELGDYLLIQTENMIYN